MKIFDKIKLLKALKSDNDTPNKSSPSTMKLSGLKSPKNVDLNHNVFKKAIFEEPIDIDGDLLIITESSSNDSLSSDTLSDKEEEKVPEKPT